MPDEHLTDERGPDGKGVSWSEARLHVRGTLALASGDAHDLVELIAAQWGLEPHQFLGSTSEELRALRERAALLAAGSGLLVLPGMPAVVLEAAAGGTAPPGGGGGRRRWVAGRTVHGAVPEGPLTVDLLHLPVLGPCSLPHADAETVPGREHDLVTLRFAATGACRVPLLGPGEAFR
ncbi:hypothetical protein ACFWXK_22650 [Streptomyces sp. NPDC059070]|uniref:hypothetical protein n=1 Tax=Streptomyces sp. NPDC059070 TaxID=3346713 RepID=UPI0036A9EBB5